MRITGDQELARNLRILGRGMSVSMIDRSAKDAADPMVISAKEKARRHRQPKRPKGGHIDEVIGFFRKKESTRTRRLYVIGATGRRKSILTWLEFGTARHFQPRRFGGIWHPGSRAFPIMRPAFDEHGDKTISRFGASAWRQFERLVVSLSKGRR